MTTAIATNGGKKGPAKPADVLRGLLERSKDQIAQALPKHLTPERMIRMAMTVFNSPKGSLQRCDPITVLACVIQASELGLELSGPLGHAWIVPYGRVATFQIGYRGLFELAFRTGKVSAFPMRTVHAADAFKVRYGTNQSIEHEPAMKDRGEVIGYYSVLYLKDGGNDFHFMSKQDVEKHRDRYVKNKGGDSPWNTAFDAMAMKTTVRQLAKRAPLSTEFQRAVTYDEHEEAGILDHRATTGLSQTDVALAQLGGIAGGDDGAADQDQLYRLSVLSRELSQEEFAGLCRQAGAEEPMKLTSAQADQLILQLEASAKETAEKAPAAEREPGEEG